MLPGLVDGLDLFVLTVGYWIADRLLRCHGWLATLARLGIRRRSLALGLSVGGLVTVAPFWRWSAVPDGELVRGFLLGLVAMLAWKATTKDIDVATGEAHWFARIGLAAAVVGSYFSPAFMLVAALLLNSPFALWEHHSALPMRVVQAGIAYSVGSSVSSCTSLLGDAAILVFFIAIIVSSHYVITALAKALLGPRWYSWMVENRLHHMAASAYSWGWMRFLPWAKWRKVVRALRAVEKPLQFGTFGLELFAPLALLHPNVAIGFCIAWSAFHMGVFAASGLLFWDWIATDLMFAAFVAFLPPELTEKVFGGLPALVALLFLMVFPLRHRLWKPMPLGWFDSPFTQRIHWRVRGASGAWYGLYNDFMCPHERLYGKVHGCFLAPVPVVTYHLGEVWKPELRDALRAAGPDPKRLDEVRHRFGIVPHNEAMAEHHLAYLRRFFTALHRGARKRVLPRALGWLKAPGDQIYYWGDLPPYRGQEPVTEVTLHYREEYFDGENLQRIRDECVSSITIDEHELPPPVRELTPKQMDDYLLSLAAGRLIDLPGFRSDYLSGDDGAVRGVIRPTETTRS